MSAAESSDKTSANTEAAPNLMRLPPLSLYIHIPWCVRKCPYCDFNSHQQNGELPEDNYIDALLQDLQQDLPYVQGRELSSIFFGGGTPSLFSARSFERLLGAIQQMIPFAANIEITLEANPGTAERQKFADYRKIGINRLSIGIQSFAEKQLQNLGRIHGSDDSCKAIEFAVAAGFDNFNLDIMYGLERQSLDAAMADLQEAISSKPQHISWYQLTIEPNTEFFRYPPPLPKEKLILDMQDSGLALLAANGFERYEVSAFAQKGRQARHNLNYWLFGDYIGIGAGAHGKLSIPSRHWIVRTRKNKQPAHYLAVLDRIENLAHPQSSEQRASFTAEVSAIETKELAIEFMLNALRMPQGFPKAMFEERTGLAFSTVEKRVESLQRKGLLAVSETAVHCTERGMQLLNTVLEEFL